MTTTVSQGATNDKYDRQLRLWGPHGQKLLGDAHVCLLNAGATGSEALKNLVLPGIGGMTIVDHRLVSQEDLSENFFVTSDRIGEPRAQVVCELLSELNPDVKGIALNRAVSELLYNHHAKKNEYEGSSSTGRWRGEGHGQGKGEWNGKDTVGFLKGFTLIIATQLRMSEMVTLSCLCAEAGVPLIVGRTLGLLGHIRISAREHRIVESKPDPAPAVDLRIANPWPELHSFARNINLQQLDDRDFKHVPYIAILIQAADAWREAHSGNLPNTTEEKNEFRAQIKNSARQPWGTEENFLEALENAFLAFAPRPIPFEVSEILSDPETALPRGADTPSFWILSRALKDFVANEGQGLLPLSGTLPDMTSTTNMYVELQNLYKKKAEQDYQAISSRVDNLLSQLGLDSQTIPVEERMRFCKSAYELQVLRFRGIDKEVDPASIQKDAIQMATIIDPSDHSAAKWYLAWRAADAFSEHHNGRYPGEGADADLRQDSQTVLEKAKELISGMHLDDVEISQAHAQEITRFGGIKEELHNIGALMGGMVSQEAIKLITHQYVPLNNTYLYNGITCSGASMLL